MGPRVSVDDMEIKINFTLPVLELQPPEACRYTDTCISNIDNTSNEEETSNNRRKETLASPI
jgi:hypothetical protein